MYDKMFVVTHKKMDKRINMENYSYIQVNCDNNCDLGFEYKDNKGINISKKNPNYCELTALYWIWKNYKCKPNSIIGLCHYRRFFSKKNKKNIKYFVSLDECKKILKNNDIIVPKKFMFPVTTYEYYFKHGAGKEKDLIILREVIKEKYPEYLSTFNNYCSKKSGYYCNMMVCAKKNLDCYCKWLFEILFELEKKINLDEYSQMEARVYGYLSELLLNVYIEKNNLKISELYMINTEEKSSKIKKFLKKILKK